MFRYRVTLAMRSRALPHVDTIATYHVEAATEASALRIASRTAFREGMPTTSIRRVTVAMTRVVTP